MGEVAGCAAGRQELGMCSTTAQDRGFFCFSPIFKEILQYIEIWNEFISWKSLCTFLAR